MTGLGRHSWIGYREVAFMNNRAKRNPSDILRDDNEASRAVDQSCLPRFLCQYRTLPIDTNVWLKQNQSCMHF